MIERDGTSRRLPLKVDFDPYGGCLDAMCAWENFGGLTIAEAYEKFCEAPISYQEDFMFMGGAAFSYYFPVVERYVRESRGDAAYDYEVQAMWILAHCIAHQFDADNLRHTEHLRSRVLDLITHVHNNLSQYCIHADEQHRVNTAWAELHSQLTADNNVS